MEIDGLKSLTPAAWKKLEVPAASKRLGRLMHFRLPKGEDDKFDTELFIFHFQPGGGGSVTANIDRWKKQFVPPKGKAIDDVTEVKEFTVGEVEVTYVDVRGTYKFKKAPMIPDAQAEHRPDHRLLAVYFGSKRGPFFFRLVGPAKTVERHKKGFEDWVKGFK